MNAISTLAPRISAIDFDSRQGYAVAKLALDQAKAQGEAAAELVRAAAAPVESRTSSSPCATGGTLDTYA